MTTTRQDLARSLFTPLSRGAALFLLALGLIGAGPIASAQSTADAPETRSAQWQDHFDEQMARQLRQAPSLRASLIEVAIAQASKENAPSLSRTTEALLHVVDESPRQEHRVLAVQALSVIGPEHLGDKQYGRVIRRLYTLAETDPSAKVRTAVADVIARQQTG
jgi:hypothetical protein